jgi:radical SAM superfamily enzyme YgiQ (UPF0313 family)
MPGFILGLPGEDQITLNENIELINELRGIQNVREICISVAMPLPGTKYFQWCISNEAINKEYFSLTKKELMYDDSLDYYLLCKLFVDNYCSVKYETLSETIGSLKTEVGSGMASWDIMNSASAILNT